MDAGYKLFSSGSACDSPQNSFILQDVFRFVREEVFSVTRDPEMQFLMVKIPYQKSTVKDCLAGVIAV